MKKMLKTRKRKESVDSLLPVPSGEQIASLSRLLAQSISEDNRTRRYATVKKILTLLGVGTVLGLSMISPAAIMLAKPVLDAKRDKERNEWKKFNPSYLRQAIGRLRKEKLVSISVNEAGERVVELTKNGKRRVLRYALDNLTVEKQPFWDGKWRIVLYDVKERKKKLRDIFRETLHSLGFLQLQESVWIYPYPCQEQVSFLREYYGVGNDVLYVTVDRLEDDSPYRTYFDLS